MPGPGHGHHGGAQLLYVPIYYPYYGWGGFYSGWFGWGNWVWNWTTCPKCMAMVRTSSNYCNYCGNLMPQVAKLELKSCGTCGEKIQTSANFCQYCGADTRDLKKLKARMRFSWLNDMEQRYASDHTRFRVGGLSNAEDDSEGPVFDKAKKKAKDANEAVMVSVVLLEKRGEIDSFPWALVEPNGTIEFVYP